MGYRIFKVGVCYGDLRYWVCISTSLGSTVSGSLQL